MDSRGWRGWIRERMGVRGSCEIAVHWTGLDWTFPRQVGWVLYCIVGLVWSGLSGMSDGGKEVGREVGREGSREGGRDWM